ncbi:MAG: SGNH/GDSL hydrolase family protein [Labilithrix sp.]|nr:SGNH/GDSL hydrolase family protein [Labilithrix sp.]MCW5816081.1 SGNH/GDSL hydrolase family protein [Labilithrix sp.]
MRRFALVFLIAFPIACDHSSTASPRPSEVPDATVTAQKEEIRYLALGDSFTIGTGNPPSQAFPARLAERWRAAGRTVTLKNLGVNGYTTDDLTARELPEVKPFAPTLVTLAIGANDRVRGTPVDVYRAHVKSILKAIVDAGVTPKQLVSLPQPDWSLSPAASSFGEPAAIGADIVKFNGALKEETEAIGARYIDLFPLMHKQAEAKMLAKDGLHPNAQAHDEWAAELFKSLP